jgi:hypothetical protein
MSDLSAGCFSLLNSSVGTVSCIIVCRFFSFSCVKLLNSTRVCKNKTIDLNEEAKENEILSAYQKREIKLESA